MLGNTVRNNAIDQAARDEKIGCFSPCYNSDHARNALQVTATASPDRIRCKLLTCCWLALAEFSIYEPYVYIAMLAYLLVYAMRVNSASNL